MNDHTLSDSPGDDAPTSPDGETATVPAPAQAEMPTTPGPGSDGDGPTGDGPAAPNGGAGRGWIWGGVALVAVVALLVGAYFVGRSSVSEGPSSLADAAQQTASGKLPVGHVSLGELGKALGGSNGDVLKGLDQLGGKGTGDSLFQALLDQLGKHLQDGLSGKDSTGGSSSSTAAPSAFIGVSTANAADQGGAQVTSVKADSPAADAGLQAGDVITAIDGNAVKGSASLATQVTAHNPGDVVTVTYSRNGTSADVRVRFGNTVTPTTTTTPAI